MQAIGWDSKPVSSPWFLIAVALHSDVECQNWLQEVLASGRQVYLHVAAVQPIAVFTAALRPPVMGDALRVAQHKLLEKIVYFLNHL